MVVVPPPTIPKLAPLKIYCNLTRMVGVPPPTIPKNLHNQKIVVAVNVWLVFRHQPFLIKNLHN
jgi:hypothetical protein